VENCHSNIEGLLKEIYNFKSSHVIHGVVSCSVALRLFETTFVSPVAFNYIWRRSHLLNAYEIFSNIFVTFTEHRYKANNFNRFNLM
jgi:hypothetical protein